MSNQDPAFPGDFPSKLASGKSGKRRDSSEPFTSDLLWIIRSVGQTMYSSCKYGNSFASSSAFAADKGAIPGGTLRTVGLPVIFLQGRMRELHTWKYTYLMWMVPRAQCRGSSQQETQVAPLAYIVSFRESESLCIFTESAAHLPVLFAISCVGDGVSNWLGL